MPAQRKGKIIVLFFFLATAFTCQITEAADPDEWDCRQAGEEWICITRDKQPPPSPQPTPSPPAFKEPLKAKPLPRQVPEVRIGKLPGMRKVPEPRVTRGLPAGWTCQADDLQSGWRCKLIGTDPGGKPHLAATVTQKPFLLPSAFTPDDDQLFDTLLKVLPKDPWPAYCETGNAALGGKDFIEYRTNLPLNLEADFSQSLDEELIFFSGNVKAQRGQQRLWADALAYDSNAHILNAWSNVIYEEAGYLFASDNAWLDIDNEKARLTHSHFLLGPVPGRGTTARSLFESEQLSRHHQVTYTTCPIGNEDWVIHAKDLRINRESGRAAGHHVWLEFMHIPFLYSPYFAYPIDDRRITGFLTPSFGRSDTRGFDFALPFYWNMAPNYDLTLIPRIMSDRGFMGGMDFRYLLSHTQGHLAGELLPYDTIRQKTRGQIAFLNQTRINPYWSTFADIRYVSDKHYINELGDSLSIASNRHMRSEARIQYRSKDWFFLTRLENWQTIDPNIPNQDKPYRRLPQIQLNYNHALTHWLFAGWGSDFVFFQHQDLIDGQRLHLRPSVSLPLLTAATFLIPKVSFDYTHYWFSGRGEQRTRAVPVASVDSGLFLEKSWGESILQTLEPRLFYLYTPRTNQNDIPIFDSARYDFNFGQLFRENRFSGNDRINDANQFSVALTSRLLESKSGEERLRASLGQIYYLKDRRVTLPDEDPETRNTSNIIAELDLLPIKTFSWHSGIQWDHQNNRMDRGETLLQYKDTNDYLVNLGYRFRRDQLKIVDGSFRWRLFPSLHAVGRWQYSLRDDITLESFLGVEAESCCWRLRLIGRRFVRDVNRQTDTAVFAQLELKGLVNLGRHVDQFLERNIRGYGLDD